jgi:hypothetical protein
MIAFGILFLLAFAGICIYIYRIPVASKKPD